MGLCRNPAFFFPVDILAEIFLLMIQAKAWDFNEHRGRWVCGLWTVVKQSSVLTCSVSDLGLSSWVALGDTNRIIPHGIVLGLSARRPVWRFALPG